MCYFHSFRSLFAFRDKIMTREMHIVSQFFPNTPYIHSFISTVSFYDSVYYTQMYIYIWYVYSRGGLLCSCVIRAANCFFAPPQKPFVNQNLHSLLLGVFLSAQGCVNYLQSELCMCVTVSGLWCNVWVWVLLWGCMLRRTNGSSTISGIGNDGFPMPAFIVLSTTTTM